METGRKNNEQKEKSRVRCGHVTAYVQAGTRKRVSASGEEAVAGCGTSERGVKEERKILRKWRRKRGKERGRGR